MLFVACILLLDKFVQLLLFYIAGDLFGVKS